jgi:hypothetical protein
MNVMQFAPRPTADAGLFEPLRSLAGLRPGDGIEQTGPHAARLLIATDTPAFDVRRDGRSLLVVSTGGEAESVLRRYDLADGVSITATRRTSGGCEIEFTRDGKRRPARTAGGGATGTAAG